MNKITINELREHLSEKMGQFNVMGFNDRVVINRLRAIRSAMAEIDLAEQEINQYKGDRDNV